MKRYAIPPTGCCEYLTAGKKYAVLGETEMSFSVVDDEGDTLACCLKEGCLHACLRNWTLVDEPEDAPLTQTTSQDYRVTGPSSEGVVCIEFESAENMIWLTKYDVESLLARFEKEV